IEPRGLALAAPAQVTIPFDEATITNVQRFDDEVKVWVKDTNAAHWSQKKQTDSQEASVTFDLDALTDFAAGVNPPKDVDVVRFHMVPNPKLAKCLAAHPDDPSRVPSADVVVVRGELNDALFMTATNIKPGLKFDLFTVERS